MGSMTTESLARDLKGFLEGRVAADDSEFVSATGAFNAGEYEPAIAALSVFAAERRLALPAQLMQSLAEFAGRSDIDDGDALDVNESLETLHATGAA
ncbi:hypothetical protein GCM10009624_15170 [Gordonia sinesedis]